MSATPYVRRNAWTLPAGDQTLYLYAEAVAAMQARQPTDPTSWSYQAGIHGSETEHRELFNECKHGSWFFVAWHRFFIYYFERIVRAAVVEAGGPTDWALPYWNYGLGGQQATLPNPFRPSPGGGAPNPLYVAQRAPGINEGHALPAAAITDKFALSRPHFVGAQEFGGGEAPANQQFWSQTGRLEQTPHNDVHNEVGGSEGLMTNPDTAAQDPIFWLHHSNIDRIWALWNGQGRTDPEQQAWKTQTFKFFDADGSRVTRSCEEAVSIAALGYSYDTLVPPAVPAPVVAAVAMAVPPREPQIVGASTSTITLTGQPAEVDVPIDQPAATAATQAATGEPRVYLNVEDIDGAHNPGVVYATYVDLPASPDEQTLATHHAGNVSFFGLERARNPREGEQAHTLRVTMEITHIVKALQASHAWDPHEVHVSFRPLQLVPPPGEQPVTDTSDAARSPVRVGRVSVSYG